MELPSKFLEQIAFNTRPKMEEHMLIVMDKSTHEQHLSQPLQTNNKQFKIAVTFPSSYNGIFNVKNTNNRFYFKERITDEDGLFELLYLQELIKSNHLTMKLNEISSMKVILQKLITHSQSNQFSQL